MRQILLVFWFILLCWFGFQYLTSMQPRIQVQSLKDLPNDLTLEEWRSFIKESADQYQLWKRIQQEARDEAVKLLWCEETLEEE